MIFDPWTPIPVALTLEIDVWFRPAYPFYSRGSEKHACFALRGLTSGVSLNVPAGLWGKKKQFTSEEILYSREIAQARIHVERTIGCVFNCIMYKFCQIKNRYQATRYNVQFTFICGMRQFTLICGDKLQNILTWEIQNIVVFSVLN